MASMARAPFAVAAGLVFALLVTNIDPVSFISCWAVPTQTIDIGYVKVVHLEINLTSELLEVLQLRDVVALALFSLGDLDRDTGVVVSITQIRCLVGIVLGVSSASLECHHAIRRAPISLEDRPNVNIVRAAVDDAYVGLVRVGDGIESDGGPQCIGRRDHGRRGKEGGKLHYC